MPDQPSIEIVRRRVDLQFETADAVDWYPEDRAVEVFLDAISLLFPTGEKFFIDSVRRYQGRITDEVLQEQVRRFIHQEAMHTSVHRRFNSALLAAYPRVGRVEAVARFWLTLARWFTPGAYQLAASCAIEHYTAILADSLLRRLDRVMVTAQPDCVRMWTWHAVEETEHKAVCYDVYRTMVGSGPFAYLLRALAMVIVTLLFAASVAVGVAVLRGGGRRSSAGKSVSTAIRRQSVRHLLVTVVPWRLWLDYFRPSFHPWDHDNSELVAQWKRRFPDFGITSGESGESGGSVSSDQGLRNESR